MQPLHELAFSLKGQAIGDLTKPVGEEEWGQAGDTINARGSEPQAVRKDTPVPLVRGSR